MEIKTTVCYNPNFEGKDYVCYLHPKYKEIGKGSTPNLICSIVRFLEASKDVEFQFIIKEVERQKQFK